MCSNKWKFIKRNVTLKKLSALISQCTNEILTHFVKFTFLKLSGIIQSAFEIALSVFCPKKSGQKGWPKNV